MSKAEERSDTPDLDDVLFATGYFGKYHFFQVVLQMLIGFSVAFPLLNTVFIGYEVPHVCSSLDNVTDIELPEVVIDNQTNIEYMECSIRLQRNTSGMMSESYLPCVAGHNYSRPREVSISAEWDLVCDRSGLGELSQTMMMLGQGFGGLIFSSMSDKYGRKPLYISTLASLGALCYGMAFSPNIVVYIVIRFLIGAFQQGSGLTAYTLFVESLSSAQRPLAGTVGGVVWSISVMTMAPIAYGMRNYSWRYLQIALSCSSLYVFILYWTLDESLRWLLANNKVKTAKKNTAKAARMDGRDPDVAIAVLEKVVRAQNPEPLVVVKDTSFRTDEGDVDKLIANGDSEKRVSPQNTQYSILDLFRHKAILQTSAITWYIWTVNSLTYYGLFLTATSLAGDRFINFFLSSIVEIPGTVSVFFMLKIFGRRQVAMLYHFMAGVSLIISVIIISIAGDTSAGSTAATVFNMFGKFAITGSFNSLFIYSPELFPTNLRNAGLGVGSAMSRVGGMSAPYSKLLMELVEWGPGAIFGSLCLVASFLIRYLPETKGRQLPTTIAEVKDMYKGKKSDDEKPTKK